MSKVIFEEGGTLDKFEGDAIMAFFGAPLDQPDHALRAARTAIKMRQKLSELLQKWPNDPPLPGGEKKPVIDFRCGLSTGSAIVGNIGSTERFDYTAMGDIVNLGSRLEGANKKYDTRIMCSETTYEIIRDQFEGRELDLIRVVGKNQPIRIYEIIASKGTLPAEPMNLLKLYSEGIALYHSRKFADGLAKFNDILKIYTTDGPSKLYRQRCEVLRDFPPKDDWDGVFQMGSK
jgi:adenylate cyclase